MNNVYFNKKGVSPVIAIALLLIMTVLVVVNFQGWYGQYSSKMFSDAEIKSNSASSKSLSIEKLVGNNLYVINNIEEGLNISNLRFENISCNNLYPLTLGLNIINVSDCLGDLVTSTPDIVLVTEDKIVQKKEFIKEISNLGGGSGGGSVPSQQRFFLANTGFDDDRLVDICLDSSGNIYMAGLTYGEMDFGNGNSLTSTGDYDFYLAKYDSSGNILWARNPNSATGEEDITSIYSDNSGNVYLTGYTTGSSIDFGNGVVMNNLCNFGYFLVKYNSVGVAQWVDSYNCANVNDYTRGNSVYGDSVGNIYVTGNYEDSGGTGTMFFLRKFDTNANLLWERNSSFLPDIRGEEVFVDSSNNVYMGGTLNANFFDFGNGVTISKSSGYTSFIVKYNSAGVAQNVVHTQGPDEDWIITMFVDNSGNMYMSSYFTSIVDFGGGNIVTATQNSEFYIVKYNSAGVLQWVVSSNGDRDEDLNSIYVDNLGNVYGAGFTDSNSLNFGNGIILPKDYSTDFFVIKYDSNGFPVSLMKSLNSTGYSSDYAQSIVGDGLGNIYVGFETRSSGLEIYNNYTLPVYSGLRDAFVFKYLSSDFN